LFEEVQTFNRKGLSTLFKILIGLLLLCYILIFFFIGKNYNNHFLWLIFVAIILLVFSSLFTKGRLITQFRRDGIYVRFPPLYGSLQFFPWENITELYIRQYDPVMEYGGWGIRTGSSGRSFSVSGETGLQLVLKDKSRFLIGTENPALMADVLKKLNILNF
jgi:hypothetical protein